MARSGFAVVLAAAIIVVSISAISCSPEQPPQTPVPPPATSAQVPAPSSPVPPVTDPVPAPTPTPSATLPSERPTAATTAPDAATPTPVLTPASEPAIKVIAAKVISVTDGDTIRVSLAGKTESVRLIGIDTPETVHPSRPAEPFGQEASAYTKRTVNGRTVWLEFDVQERDRHGRLLAYVWLEEPKDDGQAAVRAGMLNAMLLAEGYAQLATFPPNVKYVDIFTVLQEEAREAGKGLWKAAPAPQAPQAAGVLIASVDLRAEAVVVKNSSNEPVDISGWTLVSERGDQRFVFPDGTKIPAGGSISVVSGPNATTGAGRLLWTRSHIWHNDGDPATLLNGSGEKVSSK